LLIFAPLASVHAQDPDQNQSDPGPEYEAARQKAVQAYQGGDYAKAAELFEQAFNLNPQGNLLYNIAACHDKAGHLVDAVSFYQRFMEAVPDSPKRPEVARRVADLQQQLKSQYEDVTVNTDPSGAVIFVDDKAHGAMGNSPVTFKLFPGKYTIIAEKDGFEPTKQKVEVMAGNPAMFDLSLLPKGAVASVNLRISERDADVLVDAKRVGKTPLEDALRLPQGTHEIVVMKPGFAPWKGSVDLRGGETKDVSVSLVPEGGESEDVAGGGGGAGIWPYVTMGVGAAAIGGAVYTGLSAKHLHDQLEDKRKNGDPIAKQDVDTGNKLVLMTNVLYGVGGAAVVGGALWWYFGRDSGGPSVNGGVVPVEGGSMIQFGGAF
jgi:hypothetical protein